ncbi:MAG: polysaccharide deacetylase family protein [Longimicrobiales bacterium]
MNPLLERAVDRVLVRSPAQPFFRRRAARDLVVLAYHGVDDPVSFERQIAFLAATLQPVTLADVLAAITDRARLPEAAVLVTFDDGDASVFEHGCAILSKHCVPAAAFVVAGLIGTSQPFWWDEAAKLVRRGATAQSLRCGTAAEALRVLKALPDEDRRAALDELRHSAGEPVRARQLTADELRALAAAGVAIGNHTLTHPCLDRCSDERVEHEIAHAHAVLCNLLGVQPKAFAWPNGNADARAAGVLQRLGYEAAFLFDHRIGAFPPADSLAISRVRVNARTTMDRFRLFVSGLHSRLHYAAGRA